jgi:ferredoxin-NADP reductase
MAPGIVEYELRAAGGEPLPEWRAGAHIDVVVAPEYLRQYSLAGDPAERGRYRIGVLREEAGRGGSKLMQRIFAEGRRVFIGRPINHFPLEEGAERSFLMGGGIGVTPMIAMAHRLHALGRDFELHYSIRARAAAGYLDDLAAMPWAGRVRLHVSDEGTRADFAAVLTGYRPGWHVYACGPERHIAAVLAAAEAAGFPDDARHAEYFTPPEEPDYENHPFTIRLARSGREVAVPADLSAAEALIAAGVPVDLKCSDGLCGVCKAALVSGAVEHRDHVLSAAERAGALILCRSRAAEPGGVIEIDL